MPQVRLDASKWARNSQAAGSDYVQGASNPRTPWAAAAGASEEVYKAGISEAMSRNAYSKGISKAGDAKWQQGIKEKGANNYRSGVALASSQTRYQSGFAPYASAIGSVSLQPRGPKGTNYGRVQQIGEALMAVKRNS